ncbi:MAG: cupredoxin domain-containing protein [Rickettsiales bacterium]
MKKILISAVALSTFFSFSALADTPIFNIIIKDHKFQPDVLEIPADKKVKLVIDNQDPTAEEFESNDFNREKVIGGNSKGVIFVGPLKAGEYKFFGEFNMDSAKGKLIAK